MNVPENQTILEYLRESDDSYYREKNVFYAEKAFKVRSVINWFVEKRNNDLIDDHTLEIYLSLVDKYIKNKVDFHWSGDGELDVKKIQNN